MKVTLLYFDGCLRAALDGTGTSDVEVTYGKVLTPREAESVEFRGSPTILIDGRDPFPDREAPVGLSCRVYRTGAGLTGAPTVEQLVAVLR
ncbi:thioredoxin family protein [Geodermatophilus sp. URMC 65]